MTTAKTSNASRDDDTVHGLVRRAEMPGGPLIRCLICGLIKPDTNRGYWGEPVCEDCFQGEIAKGVPAADHETGKMLYSQNAAGQGRRQPYPGPDCSQGGCR